jgi:nitroreductase
MEPAGPDLQYTERDAPDVAKIAIIGIVGALILFVIIVGLQALFYGMEREEVTRKQVASPPMTVTQLRAQHEEQLTTYRWIDQKAGIVAIPVDRAMKLVVAESSKSD